LRPNHAATLEQKKNPSKTPAEPEFQSPKQVVQLRKLIIRCKNALSYASQYGGKGQLITNLLTLVDSKANLTQEDMKQAIYELTKITLSYRPSSFFQAAYAETRSSTALIAAITDPAFNQNLPIAELLLGEAIDPRKETTDEIVQRLRKLQVLNRWQTCSLDISPMATL